MTTIQSTYGNSNIDGLLTGHKKETEEKKDPLGRDSFLNMLIAQLKHQDPLNPMEGTDFTAQLAQFSMLEQQFNTNDNLESLVEAVTAKKEDNLIEYIGKEVSGSARTIMLNKGETSGGTYTLDSAADVSISIYDGEGKEVRTIYAGQMSPGEHEIKWDGKDYAGQSLADGTYGYEVFAVDITGGVVPVKTSITGRVTGVTYQNGTPYLQVGKQLLDPSSVQHVWVPEDTAAGNAGATIPDEET